MSRVMSPERSSERPIDAVEKQHVEVNVELSAEPKRGINVTAPVFALRRAMRTFLIKCPEMAR
jgi:hypothetical protein